MPAPRTAQPALPRHVRALLDRLPAMIGYWDTGLRNVLANQAYLEWFGRTPEDILGRHIREIIGESLYALNLPYLTAALGGTSQRFERQVTSADGRTRHTQAEYLPDVDEDGRVRGVVVLVTDVTERVQERAALAAAVTAEQEAQARLTEAADFQSAVLAISPDLVNVMDLLTNEVVWSSRAPGTLLGLEPDDPIPLDAGAVATLLHPDDLETHLASRAATAALADGEVLTLRVRVRHGDGTYHCLSRRLTPFRRDAAGTVTQVLGVTRDITDSVAVEERLALAATHDALTGLPNRTLLADRIQQALQRRARAGGEVAVLFLDLDGFKRVNDTGGHRGGDAVLVAVGQRLRSVLRPADTVARVGGDEFVVLLEPDGAGADDGDPAADFRAGVLRVAERICAAVGQPVREGSDLHHVTASIGVTFATSGDDPESVLRDADAAMYRAKDRGKDRAELFDGVLRAGAVERGRIGAALRAALHADPARPGGAVLDVAYQPVFDLTGGARLVGVEALARLTDEHGVPVPPGEFIPVAEDTGLIAELGRRVLSRACGDLAAWHAACPAFRHLGVSVNVSARQAGLADLVGDVTAVLAATGVAPAQLTLDLTESVLVGAGRSTRAALDALRQHGVQIALDDYGTGCAGLRSLAELPVTSVKVARTVTAGLPDDRVSAYVVHAVAGLARDLGLGCVVVGVETDAQLRALPRGVLAQGHLLGRPVPAATLLATLSGRAAALRP